MRVKVFNLSLGWHQYDWEPVSTWTQHERSAKGQPAQLALQLPACHQVSNFSLNFHRIIYNEEPSSWRLNKKLTAKYKPNTRFSPNTHWDVLICLGFAFKVIMNRFQWHSPLGNNGMHVKLACMSLCRGRKPVAPEGTLCRQTCKSLVWAWSQIQEHARAAGQMTTSGFIRGGGPVTIRKTSLMLQPSFQQQFHCEKSNNVLLQMRSWQG